MSIYLGEAGPEIIKYLLENGAATTYTFTIELHLSKQTISHNLANLERLGLVKRRDQAIVDKRLTKRGPKDKIWVLEGATPKSIELAVIKDLKLRNPERVKAMEDEAEAKREEERRQKEAAMMQLQEEAKYHSWINAQVDGLLKSATSEKIDYSEVETYIRTLTDPLNDVRTLRYHFRDRLKELGRWR